LLNASFELRIENPKEKSGTALDHEMPPLRFPDRDWDAAFRASPQEIAGTNSRNHGNGLGIARHFLPSFRRLPQAPVARILPKITMPADLIEYEEAYCRRQIALALLVDVLKQFRYSDALIVRNFFQVVPEGVFETNARLVAINHNGAFDD
jgi:hypothetical protein